jgi:hypothetical protein
MQLGALYMETVYRLDLLRELRSHYIAVLAYSLGEQRSDVTKADATSAEIAAVRAFIKHLEAQVIQAASPAPIAPQQPAQRDSGAKCPFYRRIRFAFGMAQNRGLDTEADEAMRAAFSRFLGRTITSREELDGDEWLLVGKAIKNKLLTW